MIQKKQTQYCNLHPNKKLDKKNICWECKKLKKKVKRSLISKEESAPSKDKGIKKRNKRLQEYRKDRIRKRTKAELHFESLLKQIPQIKFLSEKIIQPKSPNHNGYLLDFYIPNPYNICFEIDGGYHLESKQREKDKGRDKWLLKNRNIKTIRFTNEEVYKLEIKDLIVYLES